MHKKQHDKGANRTSRAPGMSIYKDTTMNKKAALRLALLRKHDAVLKAQDESRPLTGEAFMSFMIDIGNSFSYLCQEIGEKAARSFQAEQDYEIRKLGPYGVQQAIQVFEDLEKLEGIDLEELSKRSDPHRILIQFLFGRLEQTHLSFNVETLVKLQVIELKRNQIKVDRQEIERCYDRADKFLKGEF